MAPELRRRILTARVLLSVTGLILFAGPMARDSNESHLLNAAWPGHARLHFMWALGFMLFSGVANFYYLWLKRPFQVSSLHLSCAWQACNLLGGFWFAVALMDLYGGTIRDPAHHVLIMGINENVLIFAIMAVILVGTWLFIRLRIDPAMTVEKQEDRTGSRG